MKYTPWQTQTARGFHLWYRHPGVPVPIKLQEQHRAIFPLDQPIDEEAGKRVAAWAAGGKAPEPQATQAMPQTRKPKPPPTRDQVIASFKAIGVERAALELYVGDNGMPKFVDEWTPDDLVSLREFYRDKQAEGGMI